MRVTTERLENCQVQMIVELDAAEADEKLRTTARKISRKVTVPGYRRGKAPFQAVIRAFGREIVQQEAIEDFGQELYDEAIKQIEYDLFEPGALQEVEWEPFRMKVLLPIRPEVDLGDYRSIQIPFEVPPVTEEQIANYLADLQQQHAQWVPVERPAAPGDQVVLDYRATADNHEVLSRENIELVLQERAMSPLPGFHEQIVAMSAKEDKNFVLNVPEDFPEAGLAGQQATVQVHLHAVKQQDLPPLDDELAIMVGDYDTLEALKAGARERLEADALQAAQTEYLEKALDAFVLAAPKIEYPPQAVDREVEMALQRMQSNLASSGIQFDMFLRMIGRSREAYQQELRPSAEERLKKRLVLESLARAEQLQVTPEEVEAELERMRTLFGSEAEEMMRTLHTPGGRLVVYGDLLTTKAQERAIQIAKGEAPPIPMPDATQNLETNQEQTPVDSPSSQLESQEIQGLLDSQESTETPVEAESNPQPETNS